MHTTTTEEYTDENPMNINVFSLNIGTSNTILHRNITYDNPISTPCTHRETKHLTRSVHVVTIPMEQLDLHQDTAPERGQIDTGAQVSCPNKLHIFHNYKPYSEKFWCPIRLNAAIKQGSNNSNASIIPEREGYLLTPAINTDGYVPVKAY